jgi:hypothetical protein
MTSKSTIFSTLPAIDRAPRWTPAVQVRAVSYPARTGRITTWLHRSATPSHQHRAMLFVVIIGLMLASWWGSNTLSVNAEDGLPFIRPFRDSPRSIGAERGRPYDAQLVRASTSIAPTRRSSCGRTSTSTAGTDSWLFPLNRDVDQQR